MKICSKCKVEKNEERFRKGKGYKDGLRSNCRDCENEYKRKKWSDIKDKYSSFNNERLKKYRKDYFQKNKKDIYKKYKEKLSNDELFACREKVRNVIKQSISKMNWKKKSKTESILGCDYNFFKLYIESKFIDGMNWYNRDEWHLDHIIPISSAKNEEDVYTLNHYTNFQPLWASDNLKKSNKLDYEE